MAGEQLVGAKQNRVLNASIMVPRAFQAPHETQLRNNEKETGAFNAVQRRESNGICLGVCEMQAMNLWLKEECKRRDPVGLRPQPRRPPPSLSPVW